MMQVLEIGIALKSQTEYGSKPAAQAQTGIGSDITKPTMVGCPHGRWMGGGDDSTVDTEIEIIRRLAFRDSLSRC